LDSLPLLSLFLPPPSYNNFNRFHSSVFIYGYKINPPCTPSFPFSLCPPPSHWYPPLEKIYLSLLPFIYFFKMKYNIDSPRGFHLGTSGLYISCFNQINLLPPTSYSFSVTMLKGAAFD
jgi:hypothetical protein